MRESEAPDASASGARDTLTMRRTRALGEVTPLGAHAALGGGAG